MRHSFKIKKKELRELFQQKLDIQNISIENKNDVTNAVDLIISYLELEEVLVPVECKFDFLNNLIYFNLELLEGQSKESFFNSIKRVDNFIHRKLAE